MVGTLFMKELNLIWVREVFTKLSNIYSGAFCINKPLTTFAKSSIVDHLIGCKYASVLDTDWTYLYQKIEITQILSRINHFCKKALS